MYFKSHACFFILFADPILIKHICENKLYYILLNSDIYILFSDDLILPNSEESTRGTIFQQSTTLTAKMWPPVS